MTTISLEATRAPNLDIAVPVSTKYLIFQKRNGAFWPLRVGRTPVDAALSVFGSLEAAHRYLRVRRLGPGWQARMSGNGELASILSGLCLGVETILLDSPADGLSGRPASQMTRRRFLSLLLGDGGMLEPAFESVSIVEEASP